MAARRAANPAAPLLPGAVLGVLGSGQLGRMLALAAARLGYRLEVFSPARDTPAGRLAQREHVADYHDEAALRRFAERVDAVTIEFENVPARALEVLAERVPVRPGANALHMAQHRGREKAFLAERGFPLAPHAAVDSAAALDAALARVGAPAILKSAGFGYDGKGQRRIDAPGDARAALDEVGLPAVLEGRVAFDLEFSLLAARGGDGQLVCYPPFENHHRHGVLDVTVAPGRVPDAAAAEAREVVAELLAALDYVGVACVEFFLVGERVLVNEVAPRPHNSGHLTIEAAVTSQFEQQLRALCGLPLGDPALRAPAAMANLLGDAWRAGAPPFAELLRQPGVALHLYGKNAARPGRKMGHLTVLDTDVAAAERRARRARAILTDPGPSAPRER